ncbi:SpoIIE family protein phosphatase [Methylovulum psychrotolerans]|uniref:SpoIIE family protein phosphatase n=1 Tax=Methylovulum psychrotolerans TaxID=1704499 RepID=UPI001BFFA6E9|nr:SpoIIE family protein phosphatase [Methylovulum psychrotolerans]
MFCLLIIEYPPGAAPVIRQATAEAADLLGYHPEALLQQPLTLLCGNGDALSLWQSAITAATPFPFTFVRHNRQPLTVQISAGALCTDTPAPAIALHIETPNKLNGQYCNDIASALSDSEARFRQMAELTGEWLWEQNPEGYYLYSSAAVQQILGYTPEEVVGQHYLRFLTAQNTTVQAQNASRQTPFYDLLNEHCHKDGHRVVTESTGLPLFDGHGTLLKWRGVDRDITAKKYFQDALIASEQRTRLIIENSTNAIVIMDDEGLITDWNRQAEKTFGWTAEEAVGQVLVALIVPPPVRALFRQGLKLFLHTGICPWLNTLAEQTALRRDGTEFPIELSVSPLLINGRYSFSGFIRDISLRKAAEQQIRAAQITLAIAQNELKIAQYIQTSLLPSAPIATADFTVTGLCLPADKVGGDYFDYFYHNNRHLDMVIADVSGHSIGPALFMVEARSMIRTQAQHSGQPGAILGLLNQFLFDDLNKADYFITAFYLQYALDSQLLSYANAGHSPPLLMRANAGACELLDADGMILGIRKTIVFEEKTVHIAEGDVLLLYTDGLTEADNPQGEFFGWRRAADVLAAHAAASPQAILDALLNALKAFCQRETFTDDITLLLFKRH